MGLLPSELSLYSCIFLFLSWCRNLHFTYSPIPPFDSTVKNKKNQPAHSLQNPNEPNPILSEKMPLEQGAWWRSEFCRAVFEMGRTEICAES